MKELMSLSDNEKAKIRGAFHKYLSTEEGVETAGKILWKIGQLKRD